ncbi:hypothetical protein GWC95_11590 [Sediminibacterium roseum]|uniref:Uncharacterized protein n=1 Tax=Sediminibacterium roseum TaxID=1978412 RepID=A0ABX0A003_9BACT|nr:hypothetical protein [Sediminibacterium roseum]NCI50570.1 hypothetical protein [Sediminibacterium roseum]
MKHIMQHPARVATILLIAGTLGLLFLMRAHSNNDSACSGEKASLGIIKLI